MNQKAFVILCVLFSNTNADLTLEQVVILSRHNVRTPLSKTLWEMSPKPWPIWKEKPGYLTPKGALLEGFMGEFFFSWLNEEGLLPKTCPTEENFYVYSNTAQRTLLSAKSFITKAYPDCSIIVHHANKSDPIFNPIIHNTSAIFVKEAFNIMQKEIKHLNLNVSYELMEEILDYKKSDNCLTKHQCDLETDVNRAYVKTGSKPNVVGPLKIGKSAIDSFLMENYEGLDMKNVAWGEIQTNDKWRTLMVLSKNYHNIIFNTTFIAKDISQPLMKYMTEIFINVSPKVTLIMGHDANLYTILNTMGFKPYILENQYELTPVGGKVVFQKWSSNRKEFLKVHYVYQSTKQMREGKRLSLKNPPIFHLLELKGCKVDEKGFCLWNDFIKLLKTF